MTACSLTAGELAERVGGRVVGNAQAVATGVQGLSVATDLDVSFIAAPRHARQWAKSRAAIVLVSAKVDLPAEDPTPRAFVVVPDAELALAEVLAHFAPAPWAPDVGVHEAAWVDATATVDPTARLGPCVVVGPRTTVAAGVILHAGVVLGADVQVGSDTEIFSGTVVRDRVRIGRSVLIHQNASIGADGFGYRPAADGRGLVKMPHIGDVVIEDAVEIGAGTCVDRGKFGSTRIGAGTKIDNLVQIAHNCDIGRCCLIAGMAGLAGSVTVGDGVMIGGGARVADHLTIGPGARIGGTASVAEDIPAGEEWAGVPAVPRRRALRQWIAVRRLPSLLESLGRGLPTGEDETGSHHDSG